MTSDTGGARNTDPHTTHEAAESLNTAGLKREVMMTLRRSTHPLNGWEMSLRMRLPTITVVPRLAPLRRAGLIMQAGTRPGPSGRGQLAYVLTDDGRLATDPVRT